MILWCDFETRSECDLKARGVYNYARDASTQVLCMAWALDDGDVTVWTPGQPLPDFSQVTQVRAHNAAFERLIWNTVLVPDHGATPIALEQFYCTATQARANCAPGSLEDVGRFAGVGMKKDHRGAMLVRKCCIPPFKHSAKDLADLFEYCAQDVRAMRAGSKAMRELSPEELADYHLNERINDRGILVDVELARAAQRYAAQEVTDLQAQVVEVTGGAVPSVRSPRMREWVYNNVTPEQRALMEQDAKVSIDKTVRGNLLACDDLDPAVREVVQAADDLWSSSVAKFTRMAGLADEEDRRVRGAFVFAGGSATGRASSYGLQLHNMVRKAADDPEGLRQRIVRGHAVSSRLLKTMLRPALMAPPGRAFVNYDWSAIEARVLPWLGGGDLDVFRRGEDMYISTAKAMFRVEEVSPDQRQQAKVAVLACGFGGGVGAFDAMARAYGIRMPQEEAKRMVNLWRNANRWAPAFWGSLERSYLTAMRQRGHQIDRYIFQGDHLWYVLPSGRVLCYPFARFDDDGGVSYAKAAFKPSADATEWPRARLWPGLAAENLTQATANDILRHALRRLDAEGIEVVAHIHDEILVECDEADAERVSQRVHQIMCEPPEWAVGLPLAAEGAIRKRFGK
jgi:DNA polymerase